MRTGPGGLRYAVILDCSNPRQPTITGRARKHCKLWEETQCWQPGMPLHTGTYSLSYVIPMGFQWVLSIVYNSSSLPRMILSPQRTTNSIWRHFGVSHLIGTELWHQWNTADSQHHTTLYTQGGPSQTKPICTHMEYTRISSTLGLWAMAVHHTLMEKSSVHIKSKEQWTEQWQKIILLVRNNYFYYVD